MTAIIFDFDNTLIDSRIDFAAVRRTLAAALDPALGIGIAEAERLSIGDLVGLAPEPDRPRLWALIEGYEVEGMREAQAADGAVEVLAALRARSHALALLTNNSRRSTDEALARLGMAGAFDVIVARDDAAAMKPDPAGIEEIRRRLGAGAGSCVLVGDSWLDGLAAQRAGIPFVAYRPRPATLARHGIEAVEVVEHLRDLLPLFP